MNPDPDDFQHLTVTSTSKAISLVKVSWRSDHFLCEVANRQTNRQTLGKTYPFLAEVITIWISLDTQLTLRQLSTFSLFPHNLNKLKPIVTGQFSYDSHVNFCMLYSST